MNTDRELPLLLSLESVARELDAPLNYARSLVKSGTLPSLKLGNRYRVHRDDLRVYVRTLRSQDGEPAP